MSSRIIKEARDRVNQYSYYGVHVGQQDKDRVDEMKQALKKRRTAKGRRCIQKRGTFTIQELNSLMPRTKSGEGEPKSSERARNIRLG